MQEPDSALEHLDDLVGVNESQQEPDKERKLHRFIINHKLIIAASGLPDFKVLRPLLLGGRYPRPSRRDGEHEAGLHIFWFDTFI